MAFPTATNSQITDATTQTNVTNLATAAAVALGNLYNATGQALGNQAHAAAAHMQQSWVAAQAVTTQSVNTLLTLDAAATGKASQPRPQSPYPPGLNNA